MIKLSARHAGVTLRNGNLNDSHLYGKLLLSFRLCFHLQLKLNSKNYVPANKGTKEEFLVAN
jgi:hypothetical protein